MRPSGESDLLVSIVTWNDAGFIEKCLDSVFAQSIPVRVKVFDNDSRDGTPDLARRFPAAVIRGGANLGYCRGHNLNLLSERFDFALLLNADTRLEPDFVEKLVAGMIAVEGVGIAGGKLLRMTPDGDTVQGAAGPILDSTGIYFTPAQRHFDRGGGEEDRGQYRRRELVFGITGAAALCRRTFLEDLRFGDEYLDEDFFAYREDADLAWRAQLRGWRALYEPSALGRHARKVLPRGRSAIDPGINFHSVKNRFLMRAKNIDAAVRRRCFPYMWLRDLGIVAWVLTRERASLPAFREVRRLRPRTLEKRRIIQRSRRAAPREVARWFSFRPVSFPADGLET
jgi:GT2 family glycosyltransferase